MILVYIHGWNAEYPESYGPLAQRVATSLAAQGQPVTSAEIFLGDYVSLDDQVTLPDLARALDRALREKRIGAFAAITHSTGGPVVRQWLLDYGKALDAEAPQCSHLVMLAAPNHGSALAQLGKGRLSRLKFWAQGAEPGERLLDWLELGSEEQWHLNRRWLALDRSPWLFSLTGQTIDNQFYDHLNSYTAEEGSDGVVRAASANLAYSYLKLTQHDSSLRLTAEESSRECAFAVMPGASHSGARKGILHSAATAGWIARCLAVRDAGDYARLKEDFARLNARSIRHEGFQAVFRITDSGGQPVRDFDLLLTAGRFYSPNALPKGFFIDRQANSRTPGRVTYYVHHQPFRAIVHGNLGFKVAARPTSGMAYYGEAQIQTTVGRLMAPNQTLMVDICLERRLAGRLLQLHPAA